MVNMYVLHSSKFSDLHNCIDELAGMVADRGIFPVRVIDLQETFGNDGGIAFIEPRDWNFHTISHTWSMAMRQLSEDVGRKVKVRMNSSTSIKSAYNDVFKHTNLKDRPGYAHLVEFLQILQADGVRKVWLDALCINQVDKKEKSQEIVHMGAFYYHSLGCYVVAHGFGRGFGMTDEDDHLPRWFSRVWTFQEFLLPKRLTFIVEMGSTEFHGIVRAARKDHVMGHCDCKGEVGSAVWPWGFANPMVAGSRWSEDYDERVRWCREVIPGPVGGEDESEFWRQMESSAYRCTRGRFQRMAYLQAERSCSTQLLDVPRVEGGEKGVVLYFVDRDAYVYVLNWMRSHREYDIPLLQFPPMDAKGTEDPVQVVSELMRRFETVSGGGHPAVVREIARRDCSNEEDRVLSVLALLGLDGKMHQLRTEQTLDEQIVEMSNTMAKCNVGGLITLCVAFVRPYVYSTTAVPQMGLSWAPHFLAIGARDSHSHIDAGGHELERKHLEQLISGLQHSVGRVSVCPRGLSLSCHFLKGKLIPSLQHAQQCTAGVKLFTTASSKIGCCTCLGRSSPSMFEFVLEIKHGHALCFNSFRTTKEELLLSAAPVTTRPRYVPGSAIDYVAGGMVLNLTTIGKWNQLPPKLDFNVWLLLLGTYILRNLNSSNYARVVLVFMVCVGETKENLHKIGIVQFLPTYTNVDGSSTIHLDSFDSMDCIVGGFLKGDYNAWILKQLHASRWWNFT